MRPAEEVKVNPIAAAHWGNCTLLAVFFYLCLFVSLSFRATAQSGLSHHFSVP